jgi:DNA-binding NtrC family response regulator
MLIRALLVPDRAFELPRMETLLGQKDIVLSSVPRGGDIMERLSGRDVDLLVIRGSCLPSSNEGLIQAIRSLPEAPEVVVLTDRDDAEERAALLAAGCLAVLNFKLKDQTLIEALHTLVERRRRDAISRLRAERPEERYSLADFVSDSPTMQMFLAVVRRVTHADTSLLLLGETGVGKERLARAIHAEGSRSQGPFLAINCGALPESLLESELFGHEEGSFTGATRARKGYFELAHGGVLLLDEIGEMPLHLQVKLLRVLDERTVRRVGAERPLHVDVRVLAATNRNLQEDVAAGRFRSDLFYRLAVVTLEVPPLRERTEDIPPLVRSYLSYFRTQTGQQVEDVDEASLRALQAYDWPGNVRELVNAIERAVLLCGGDTVTLDNLPPSITALPAASARRAGSTTQAIVEALPAAAWDRPLAEARGDLVACFEREFISRLLQRTQGRVGEAARAAGINERSLYDLMRRRGLRKEEFKKRAT